MPAAHFFADDPAQVGLDPAKVQALMERAEREIKEGILPACQIAIARNGRIGAMRSFGRVTLGGVEKPATNETLFIIMSATKAIVVSCGWLLMQEGKLDLRERVADIVPEFGTNGKDIITVDQLLSYTSGFPNAPYAQKEWLDRGKRLERFAKWRLEYEPGTRFHYAPTSNMWVLAEIIERRGGRDFREFARERVAKPLGLPDLMLGIARAQSSRVADVTYVGQPPTQEEYRKAGLPGKILAVETEVTESAILGFNDPLVREAGVPGGGGIMTAGDLALFYQALLHDGRAFDGAQIWHPEILREARRVRTNAFIDPRNGFKSNRGLVLEIAGDDGHANVRGFGRTNSPQAFGHPGAAGQLGWADPATGISLAYLTNGFDRNDLREGRRMVAISSQAAGCAA
ncbi:MAG TPA: serine hydrolase domain-containing protein [Candidatus Binataceae bacterium]|jgi:CubicO group peptidase (beta-lactamase class C family)|nr:serine hydrolase domain-containing protein [Candidatus Binataceae bacterium]